MKKHTCPKCGNSKKVFAFIEEGGAHYELDRRYAHIGKNRNME